MRVRSVFLSDLHLGSTHTSHLAKLLTLSGENLFLLGDIFDLWKWRRLSYIENAFLNHIIENFKHIIYVMGNHDNNEHFVRTYIPNVDLVTNICEYQGLCWKMLLIHGHQFDKTDLAVARYTDRVYDSLLSINTKRFAWLKNCCKSLVYKSFRKFAEETRQYYGCDLIVCGHLHRPEISKKYINCGDWIEHDTVLVETEKGDLIILRARPKSKRSVPIDENHPSYGL